MLNVDTTLEFAAKLDDRLNSPLQSLTDSSYQASAGSEAVDAQTG